MLRLSLEAFVKLARFASIKIVTVGFISKLKNVRLFITAFVLLTVQASWATNLSDAYADAKEHDPVVAGAEAGLRATREIIPQSRSALLPSLLASGNTAWNERNQLTCTSPGCRDDQVNNTHGWQAQLRQPVFDLEAWFNYRSSKSRVKGAEWNFAATEQELIVRLVVAYLNVLRAEDLLESTEHAEEAVKTQLEQVQQRFDVGLVAITDVLEARAAYDSSIVLRVQAAGDHDIFFETLRTITGVAYESVERLSSELPVVDPSPSDAEEWVNTALVTNFTILSAEDALKAAERDLQAKLSGHLPTVDAVASHQHTVTGGAAFLGNKLDQDVFSLQATLPIYQGGFVHSRYKEARARVEEARQRLIERELIVTRDARNFFRAVVTDVVRVGARIKAIKSGEAALEATQTGYEVGTRNIVDVLRAQQQLFLAQFDYADSRYNYVGNLLRLKQIAGTLDEDDVAELATFNTSTDPIPHRSQLRQP